MRSIKTGIARGVIRMLTATKLGVYCDGGTGRKEQNAKEDVVLSTKKKPMIHVYVRLKERYRFLIRRLFR